MTTDLTMSERQIAQSSAIGPEKDLLASRLAYVTVGLPTAGTVGAIAYAVYDGLWFSDVVLFAIMYVITALGVEAGRLRMIVIAAATLMTASVVAISGVIGWVGLVIPHIARMLVGPSFDRLLPTALLLGASYLLLVDTLARTMARIEVPIGILTAVIGAPFFLWLLARGREGWS